MHLVTDSGLDNYVRVWSGPTSNVAWTEAETERFIKQLLFPSRCATFKGGMPPRSESMVTYCVHDGGNLADLFEASDERT